MDSNPLKKARVVVVEDSSEKVDYIKERAIDYDLDLDFELVEEDFQRRLEEFLLKALESGSRIVIFLDEALGYTERGTFMLYSILNGNPELKALKGVVVCNSENPSRQVQNISDYQLLQDSQLVCYPESAREFIPKLKEKPEFINELLNENLPNSESDVEYKNRN